VGTPQAVMQVPELTGTWSSFPYICSAPSYYFLLSNLPPVYRHTITL
jgi:hypothetical protein